MAQENHRESNIYWTKIDWALLVLILLSLLVSFSLATSFPARVPVHWNMSGQPDRYGSKYINLFLLPFFSLATLLMLSYLPRLDPFAKNYRRFSAAFQGFKVILAVFFLYLYVVILYYSYCGTNLPANLFFTPAFSALMIVIGYYLPRLKRNFFIGIKTPWTLSSDLSWNKTHRWAGKMFILVGVVNLIGLILKPEWAFIIFISVLALGGVSMTVYSYLIYQADQKTKKGD